MFCIVAPALVVEDGSFLERILQLDCKTPKVVPATIFFGDSESHDGVVLLPAANTGSGKEDPGVQLEPDQARCVVRFPNVAFKRAECVCFVRQELVGEECERVRFSLLPIGARVVSVEFNALLGEVARPDQVVAVLRQMVFTQSERQDARLVG